LPGAIACAVIKYLQMENINHMNEEATDWEVSSPAFTSFTGVVGILVVFRTSQAYSRYWEGITLVQQTTGRFLDATVSINAFTAMSKASRERISEFRQTMVSLTSLLTACCFAELLEESEHEVLEHMPVMGWWNFDEQTRSALQKSTRKAHQAFFWWQSYVVKSLGQDVLVVSPALVSRTFAEMGTGLSNFENASKLTNEPMPLNYSQITIWLLVIQWGLTPICMIRWAKRPSLAFLFSFVYTFVFWALYMVSVELEDPFGIDETDVDLIDAQQYSNECLMMLLSDDAIQTPRFSGSSAGGRGTLECTAASRIYRTRASSSHPESEQGLRVAKSRRDSPRRELQLAAASPR